MNNDVTFRNRNFEDSEGEYPLDRRDQRNYRSGMAPRWHLCLDTPDELNRGSISPCCKAVALYLSFYRNSWWRHAWCFARETERWRHAGIISRLFISVTVTPSLVEHGIRLRHHHRLRPSNLWVWGWHFGCPTERFPAHQDQGCGIATLGLEEFRNQSASLWPWNGIGMEWCKQPYTDGLVTELSLV